MGMKKFLFGLVCALCVMPVFADDGGPISAVTVAGLVEQNGTPTPNAPIDIVSNNGVLKVSPNLFDGQWQQGTFQNTGEEANSSTRIRSGFIPVNSDRYTISTPTQNVAIHEVYCYDSSENFVSKLSVSDIVVPATAKYLRFSARYNDNSNISPSSGVLVQLEQGSTATAYRPYGEIYTDGTVETIADSANHTATVATLLGVGDYRDTQNINTGAITRNVGIKVLDGTEDWKISSSNAFYLSGFITDFLKTPFIPFCTHFDGQQSVTSGTSAVNNLRACFYAGSYNEFYIRYNAITTVEQFKQWLADQYAAGTPVIVVYPLAEPTTESVAGQTMTMAPVSNKTGGVTGMTITTLLTSGATLITNIVDGIKIASTKYVETEFSALNTALANAVATVNTVVTQTIAQAASIATLQSGKQTRPDETCPAGKKCLLVTDENNIPHWYEICSGAHCLPAGYTELEYIQSDGASYLIVPYRVNNKTVFYCRYNEIQNGPQTANAVFGVTTSPDVSKANNGILRLTGESYNRMGWGNSESGSIIDVVAPKVFNTWYEVLYDQNKLYQNGILYATSATEPSTSWAAENDLGIFARNSTSVSMPAVAKISSVWAKENSEYKINLIPAKRNSDDAIGMYDMVSGEFYENAGSGEFTAGPVAE